MTPPKIEQSTRPERIDYIRQTWHCLYDCEACGKCRFLGGADPETLYADYIEGCREYIDVTKEIRNQRMR